MQLRILVITLHIQNNYLITYVNLLYVKAYKDLQPQKVNE